MIRSRVRLPAGAGGEAGCGRTWGSPGQGACWEDSRAIDRRAKKRLRTAKGDHSSSPGSGEAIGGTDLLSAGPRRRRRVAASRTRKPGAPPASPEVLVPAARRRGGHRAGARQHAAAALSSGPRESPGSGAGSPVPPPPRPTPRGAHRPGPAPRHSPLRQLRRPLPTLFPTLSGPKPRRPIPAARGLTGQNTWGLCARNRKRWLAPPPGRPGAFLGCRKFCLLCDPPGPPREIVSKGLPRSPLFPSSPFLR